MMMQAGRVLASSSQRCGVYPVMSSQLISCTRGGISWPIRLASSSRIPRRGSPDTTQITAASG